MVSSEVESFLRFLSPRTAKTYRTGLELFERFYGGDALSFLSEVQADRGRPMLERKYVEREVLSGFAEWLVKRGVVPKTVHVYASAIQSFGNSIICLRVFMRLGITGGDLFFMPFSSM